MEKQFIILGIVTILLMLDGFDVIIKSILILE